MITPHPFIKFRDEGIIVGHLLSFYADLELDLFYCVNVIRDDFDTVFKAMFKARGVTRRIDIADIFGRHHYRNLRIGTQFETAISAVRFCLKIRNQYSHCTWWDDLSGKLAFANLEEIAKKNAIVTDLTSLATRHVDVHVLSQQKLYFEYTDNLLTWVNYEGRRRAGKPSTPRQQAPKQLKRPPLDIQ